MGQKRAFDFQDVLPTDSTDSSYTAKVPTTTEPSGDGIISLPEVGKFVPEHVFLMPYGTNAANEVFAMRVWGWGYDRTDKLWIPFLLNETTCTLGNIVASKGANTFLCDTLIVVSAQGDTGNTTFISPVGDVPGSIIMPTNGARKLEFLFKKSTAAAANCLYRLMD